MRLPFGTKWEVIKAHSALYKEHFIHFFRESHEVGSGRHWSPGKQGQQNRTAGGGVRPHSGSRVSL